MSESSVVLSTSFVEQSPTTLIENEEPCVEALRLISKGQGFTSEADRNNNYRLPGNHHDSNRMREVSCTKVIFNYPR